MHDAEAQQRAGNLAQALSTYCAALDYYVAAVEYARDTEDRTVAAAIRQELLMIIERAESVKARLRSPPATRDSAPDEQAQRARWAFMLSRIPAGHRVLSEAIRCAEEAINAERKGDLHRALAALHDSLARFESARAGMAGRACDAPHRHARRSIRLRVDVSDPQLQAAIDEEMARCRARIGVIGQHRGAPRHAAQSPWWSDDCNIL